MEKEKISIITPLYNGEKFVEDAINSVINQTYKNWELLIIDDFSKDKGCEIARNYAENDSRIRIIKNEENLGVVETRNRGIREAVGRYIAFLDCDDTWNHDKLKKQINFMEEKDAAISCTDYMRMDESGNHKKLMMVKEKITYNMLLKSNIVGCLTVIYDTKKIGKKFFEDAVRSEDYVLWLDIFKETKIIYGLEEELAYYRVLDNSRSSNKIKVLKAQWLIYRKYENLSFVKAVYFFIIYFILGIKKIL